MSLLSCDGSPPIFAYVDRVEPEIPGLIIEATRGFGGEIAIENNTGEEVYIFDQEGREIYKLTRTALYERDNDGNWALVVQNRKKFVFPYHLPPVGYEGPKSTGRKKQVLSEWVVEGRVGDTPFKIYGRTVYEP